MQLELLKSKIHRATVTDANLNYEGSITIEVDQMVRQLVPSNAKNNAYSVRCINGN